MRCRRAVTTDLLTGQVGALPVTPDPAQPGLKSGQPPYHAQSAFQLIAPPDMEWVLKPVLGAGRITEPARPQPKTATCSSVRLPLRSAATIILFSLLLSPSTSRALNLASGVELLAGYDDNVDRKEENRRTESKFLSIVPSLSINGQASSNVSLGAGYELAYTRYLSDDLESQTRHSVWGDVTTRLQPRLFLDLTGKIEALENSASPDDDGLGISLSPRLIYHCSDRMSARINGNYTRWRYDSLDFDSGRVIVRLDNQQMDNHYEAGVGLTYLLSLSTYIDLAYRVDYNTSNNAIDEYNANSLLASISTATLNHMKLALGYNLGKWNYDHWRAGKKLKGKLRDDTQQRLWLSLEYSYSAVADLFFNVDMTINNSNLAYESFDRHLIYGGIRLHW
jgi:hypothetical protein